MGGERAGLVVTDLGRAVGEEHGGVAGESFCVWLCAMVVVFLGWLKTPLTIWIRVRMRWLGRWGWRERVY